MYQNITSISIPNLCDFTENPFNILNRPALLEHQACAIFDIDIMAKTIAPLGVLYTSIGNCLSQSEIRMAVKIIGKAKLKSESNEDN